jgi:hypothetical protein
MDFNRSIFITPPKARLRTRIFAFLGGDLRGLSTTALSYDWRSGNFRFRLFVTDGLSEKNSQIHDFKHGKF